VKRELEKRVAFHEKRTATMPKMMRSKHSPLTNHLGIPANPQNPRNAATTARISIVTTHDNIFL
jgi:hypothetical protein